MIDYQFNELFANITNILSYIHLEKRPLKKL